MTATARKQRQRKSFRRRNAAVFMVQIASDGKIWWFKRKGRDSERRRCVNCTYAPYSWEVGYCQTCSGLVCNTCLPSMIYLNQIGRPPPFRACRACTETD